MAYHDTDCLLDPPGDADVACPAMGQRPVLPVAAVSPPIGISEDDPEYDYYVWRLTLDAEGDGCNSVSSPVD